MPAFLIDKKTLIINSFIIEQIDLDMGGKTEKGEKQNNKKKLSEYLWFGRGYLEW